MKATMEIKMDNAAFDEPASELARILRALAERVENGSESSIRLIDCNGNAVGRFAIIGKRN